MSRNACRLVYPALIVCALMCWQYLLYTRTFCGLSPTAAAFAAAARDGAWGDVAATHSRLAVLLGSLPMQWMPPWDTTIMLLAVVARILLALTVYGLLQRHVRAWMGWIATFAAACSPGGAASVGYDGLPGILASAPLLAGWGLSAAEPSGDGGTTLPSVRADIGASLLVALGVCLVPSLWYLWPVWLVFIASQSREYLLSRLGVTAGISGGLLAVAWHGGWLSAAGVAPNTIWPAALVLSLGGVGLTGALIAGGILMSSERRMAALPYLVLLVGLFGAASVSVDPAAVACVAIGPMAVLWSLAGNEWVDNSILSERPRSVLVMAAAVTLAAAAWALQVHADREARAQRVVLFKAGARLRDARDADAARSQWIRMDDLIHPVRIWEQLAEPRNTASRALADQLQPEIRRVLQRRPPDEMTARKILAAELTRICRDGWVGEGSHSLKPTAYGSQYAAARRARERIDRTLGTDARHAVAMEDPGWTGVTDSLPLTRWYGRGRWSALPDVPIHTSRNAAGRWERQADWNRVAAHFRRYHVDAVLVGQDALERQDAWGELTRRLLRQDDGEPRHIPSGFTLGNVDWAPIAWWPENVVTARDRWYWVLYRAVPK